MQWNTKEMTSWNASSQINQDWQLTVAGISAKWLMWQAWNYSWSRFHVTCH